MDLYVNVDRAVEDWKNDTLAKKVYHMYNKEKTKGKCVYDPYGQYNCSETS